MIRFDYQEKYWNRFLAVVDAHLEDSELNKQIIIRELGTCHSTLYRRLKKKTGKTYPSFIRERRMKEACRIMQEQRTISINELADKVGFNDTRYFCCCFKRMYGLTPSEYKRSLL